MRAHNLPLIHALTGLAWANQEAALRTTKPSILAALAATATAADQAARLVQFDQLDELTPRQRELVAKCEKEIASADLLQGHPQ